MRTTISVLLVLMLIAPLAAEAVGHGLKEVRVSMAPTVHTTPPALGRRRGSRASSPGLRSRMGLATASSWRPARRGCRSTATTESPCSSRRSGNTGAFARVPRILGAPRYLILEGMAQSVHLVVADVGDRRRMPDPP